jgi:D-alanyl-lipoteichoic acid acyltransferase DltB (MBOAT superfamily)
MLFNSIAFAIFLPILFLLYWFVTNKNLKTQNTLLLIASYIFYGWWDWRFLFLLALLSLADYLIGIGIENNETNKKRKIWFITGLITNIGVLGVFKYYNFFIDGFIDLTSLVGYNLPRSTTNIVLPLGISFYVFLSLSYIIDIYKKNLNANRNIVEVLLTLSFFPIILAGPIQRPSSLLPQIQTKREFEYSKAVDGLKQILWGLFAKTIADSLSPYVDKIFQNSFDYSGSTLLLGAIFFTIQIYADFSGYSNIAIGVAKLLGFNLMRNFANPYFSRDLIDFWRKWHISLTTWFRDYVFFPLSFALSWKIDNERVLFMKKDHFIYISASIITWFLTGLWHGANYTFIIWGMVNGIILITYHLQIKPRKKLFKKLGIHNNNFILIMLETMFTLSIIVLLWIIFRADNVDQAIIYISDIFSSSLFTIPEISPLKKIALVIVFMAIEWLGREHQYAIQQLGLKWKRIFRYSFYYIIIFLTIWFGGKEQAFIYFQF